MKKNVLIIRDNGNSNCTISSYISKRLEELKIKNEVVFIENVFDEKGQKSKDYRSLQEYTNIIIVPQIIKNRNSYIIKRLESMGLSKQSYKNSIRVSTVVSYSSKSEEQVSEILNSYKNLTRGLKLKWQKGIGIDMGKAWIYRDLTTAGKVYDPILIELDFLAMDIKNNRTNHDFTFAKPKGVNGIMGRYYRLNDYMEMVKNKLAKNQEKVG